MNLIAALSPAQTGLSSFVQLAVIESKLFVLTDKEMFDVLDDTLCMTDSQSELWSWAYENSFKLQEIFDAFKNKEKIGLLIDSLKKI